MHHGYKMTTKDQTVILVNILNKYFSVIVFRLPLGQTIEYCIKWSSTVLQHKE